MSEFNCGNLLASVQKKIFPNGVAYDIMQRLDGMTVFNEETPDNLDSFDSSTYSIQSRAMNIFKVVDTKNIDAIKEACSGSGMTVKVDSVETAYIADKDETGSLSVYTFKDAKGNEVSITNINVKEAIDNEKASFDDSLQNLIDEISTGKIALPSSPYEEDSKEMAA